MSISDVSKSSRKPRDSVRPTSRLSVVFLPGYRDPRMLAGVCQFAYEAGWVLDTLFFHNGSLPLNWNGDGILSMMEVPAVNTQITQFIKVRSGTHIVELSANEPSLSIPRMLQDNVTIGRMGAEHLAAIGCTRVGFVIQHKNAFHRERHVGFCTRAAELGLEVTTIHVSSKFVLSQKSPGWLTRHVPADGCPFGIMAAADYIAQWVETACLSAGLTIPEEVAIVGVDNNREICDLAPVPISSIDNNAFNHGYEGAKLLHALMSGTKPPQREAVVPAGAIHVRESTDRLAIRHPHVASVLRCIERGFTDPNFTSSAASASIPMSKRRLNDAFQKHTGRTIYEELIHRRLQHALKLVQSTDEKLWDIAERSGFNSPEVMSRLFRRKLGHWPSTYRIGKKPANGVSDSTATPFR